LLVIEVYEVILVGVLKRWTGARSGIRDGVWTGCEEAEVLACLERAVNTCRRKDWREKGKAEDLFNRVSTD
jgi:hypothetical protein